MRADRKTKLFLAIYGQLLPFIGEGEDIISKADHEAAVSAKDEEIGNLSKSVDTLKAQIADKTKEFEALKSSKSLSKEEREQLETNLNEIKKQKETTEHQLTQRLEKTEKKFADETKKLSDEVEGWKQRFQSSTIRRDITDAAVGNKAHHPRQLVDMLQSRVRLVEVKDDSGEPTGKYESRVTYEDTDKNGKLVELDLTVSEAMKKMKDSDQYFNLFDDGQNRGPNRRPSSGDKTSLADIAKSGDVKAYREARKNKQT